MTRYQTDVVVNSTNETIFNGKDVSNIVLVDDTAIDALYLKDKLVLDINRKVIKKYDSGGVFESEFDISDDD